jgi:hypothetical protein
MNIDWRDKIGLWWIRVRSPWWWIRERLKTSAQLQKTNADLRQKISNIVSEQANALSALGEEEGRQKLIYMYGSNIPSDLEAELERRWLVARANASRLKKGIRT